VSGCRTPEIPDALHKAAATIQIDVRMLIGADGRVSAAKVVQSHPLIPDKLILDCVRAQIFEPAHLPDGTAVPYPFKRRFMFRPA
jgi:outer membrane biosynthesis protein TonB